MPDGLRETKKRETRRAISGAALRLASDRGLHGFTVEEIAREAGVSPRTFFNYFSSKEAAITGLDPDELRVVAVALEQRPSDESPVHALAAAVITDDRTLAAEVEAHTLRNALLVQHPELLPHHLAAQQEVNRVLAEALARRLDSSLVDPYPAVVVAATMAALRAGAEWHQRVRPPEPFPETLRKIIEQVAGGLAVRS